MYTLQEKLDQHATCILRSVCVWSQNIRMSRGQHIATFHVIIKDLNISTAPEKNGSRHNPHHAGWLIRGSVPSFSPRTAKEAVEKSQAPVDNWLLGLQGPYHRHAIGTFNTCSRTPIHRSLTDTCEGYNHLRAPPSLWLSNLHIASSEMVMWSTYRWSVVFWPLGVYQCLYLRLAMTNVS
jgi:hypothetical protein